MAQWQNRMNRLWRRKIPHMSIVVSLPEPDDPGSPGRRSDPAAAHFLGPRQGSVSSSSSGQCSITSIAVPILRQVETHGLAAARQTARGNVIGPLGGVQELVDGMVVDVVPDAPHGDRQANGAFEVRSLGPDRLVRSHGKRTYGKHPRAGKTMPPATGSLPAAWGAPGEPNPNCRIAKLRVLPLERPGFVGGRVRRGDRRARAPVVCGAGRRRGARSGRGREPAARLVRQRGELRAPPHGTIMTNNRFRRGCRLRHSARDVPKGIKVLFGLPLRQTTGFVASLLKLAGLDWPVPFVGRSFPWKAR